MGKKKNKAKLAKRKGKVPAGRVRASHILVIFKLVILAPDYIL